MMCGLVGIAGCLGYKDDFTMKRMLMADYFRGPDSTGLAAIRTNGDAVIGKLASNPIDLFGMESFKKALSGNTSRAFIGHNRLATKGAINTLNAHPFQFGHIIGAHNGTLDKESVKALQEKLGEEYSVDSMALFAAIERFGIEKTIKMCNEGKTSNEGAWAIVWFDQIEGSLNFLRNKHRPLYYSYEEGFKRLFWSSEWWMIRESIQASNGGYKLFTDAEGIGFFCFDEDVHYKFDLAALVAGSETRPKPKTKKLKGKEPKPEPLPAPFVSEGNVLGWPRPTGNGSGTHGGGVGTTNSHSRTNSATSTTRRRGADNDNKKLHLLHGSPVRPYAGVIDEEKFNTSYNGKCQWCNGNIAFGDVVGIYEKEGILLCEPCQESNLTRIHVRPNVFISMTQ